MSTLLTLYDNSTDEGTGEAIINQQGEYLDYPAQDDWGPSDKTGFRDPDQHDAQGFRTLYFIYPEEGGIELEFECIDPDNPAFIDGVQIEKDFTLKHPSAYKPGAKSHPIKDILLTPGIGRPTQDDMHLLPNLHASTHATGSDDPITPASIGASPEGHDHYGDYLIDYHGNVLPEPNVGYRGHIFRVEGSVGVADTLYICIKNEFDEYEWMIISLIYGAIS